MSVVYASFGVGVAACEALAGPGSAVAYASPGSAPILPSTQPALIAASSSTSAKGSSSKGAQRPPLLHKHPQLGWPLVGLPTTGLAFLYYALRPGAASRDACKRMSPAPIAMLQRAWTSLDNPVTRWVATALIAKRKGLAYQRRVTLGGIPCTVMARADPRGFARPRALFFVHGGGFVAHLFLADMAVLTSWTLGLGEEGVLLIPEYTLVPEGRYPKPITELLGAYRAALKGGEPLGFVPANLAVAGGTFVWLVWRVLHQRQDVTAPTNQPNPTPNPNTPKRHLPLPHRVRGWKPGGRAPRRRGQRPPAPRRAPPRQRRQGQ